jgi:hypothetical protein
VELRCGIPWPLTTGRDFIVFSGWEGDGYIFMGE